MFSLKSLAKLTASVAIDIVGMVTYAIPGIGEAADLVWAPVSAYLIHQLYGNIWLTYLAFFEEIMPLMDVIPTATIAWAVENRVEIGTLLIGHISSNRTVQEQAARMASEYVKGMSGGGSKSSTRNGVTMNANGSGVEETEPANISPPQPKRASSSSASASAGSGKGGNSLPPKLVFGINSDLSSIDADVLKKRKLQKGINRTLDNSPSPTKTSGAGGFI